jgi:hypothetical protein
MKNLPVGIQSFANLRSDDYLYVDKTEIIHQLISSGRSYFLSRPRRFGKSLLLSTIEAIFRGQKELFEGLYIYDKWDWSQQYPIIKIDWTMIDHSTPEAIKTSAAFYFREVAKNYGIDLVSQSASDCFRELIKSLREQSGKKVVVLIDEYDKPITSHLFDSRLDTIQCDRNCRSEISRKKTSKNFAQRSNKTNTRSTILQQISRQNNSARSCIFRKRCRLPNRRIDITRAIP